MSVLVYIVYLYIKIWPILLWPPHYNNNFIKQKLTKTFTTLLMLSSPVCINLQSRTKCSRISGLLLTMIWTVCMSLTSLVSSRIRDSTSNKCRHQKLKTPILKLKLLISSRTTCCCRPSAHQRDYWERSKIKDMLNVCQATMTKSVVLHRKRSLQCMMSLLVIYHTRLAVHSELVKVIETWLNVMALVIRN